MAENVLNIELHPTYFAYAIKESANNEYSEAHLEHLAHSSINTTINIDYLNDWLKSLQEVWNTPFAHIYIAIHGYATTWTPDWEGGLISLQNLSSSVHEKDTFIQQALNENFIFTMAIPNQLKKLLDSYFVGASILPSSFGICKKLIQNEQNTQLNLHITPTEGHFLYTQNGQVQYFNIFQYKNIDDLLYFTLLVYNTLELAPTENKLTLSGMIEEDSKIFQLLTQYVQELKITREKASVQKMDTRIINPHYISNLLHITL